MAELQITEALPKGLRESYEAPLNQQILVDCNGWRPCPEGLAAHRFIEELVPAATLTANSITVLHPFPQVFVTPNFQLLCTETKLYWLDLTTRTLTAITIVDSDTGETVLLTGGGVWQMADLGSSFVLLNGVDVVYWREGSMRRDSNISISSCCYYRGRLLLGGFSPSTTWKRGWSWLASKLIATDIADYGQVAALTLDGFQPETVWWSSILGPDAFWLFYPEEAISGTMIGATIVTNGLFSANATSWTLSNLTWASGGLVKAAGSAGTATQAVTAAIGQKYLVKFQLSSVSAGAFKAALGAVETDTYSTSGTHIAYLTVAATNPTLTLTFSAAAAMRLEWISVELVTRDHTSPLFVEQLELNQQGWRPASSVGLQLAQKQLGDLVICYAENGVTALRHYAGTTPTFGELKLLDVGIADRGAVGGDEQQHLFLDTTGCAWYLSASDQGPKLTRLGREEYLAALLGSSITVCFDAKEREFRMTGRDEDDVAIEFVFTQTGVAYSPEVVCTALQHEGLFQGLRQSALLFTDAGLETGLFDMGTRQLKYLRSVSLSYRGSGTLQAAVLYRRAIGATLTQTSWVTATSNGFCLLPLECVEFSILVNASSNTAVEKLEAITVQYDLNGRRHASTIFGA